MPVIVQLPASSAIVRRCRDIQEAASLTGRNGNQVKGDIRKIVLEDNVDKLLGRGLLEGVDRYGRPLARMADSTYRNPKRGFGPVLVPRGLRSRFITNFQAVWQNSGQGFTVLVMRYVGIVNKKGQPFAQYHLEGARKPGTNWVLPRRDVGGITPKGWAQISARMKRWSQDVIKGTN